LLTGPGPAIKKGGGAARMLRTCSNAFVVKPTAVGRFLPTINANAMPCRANFALIDISI
jgi:hypothetical protein